MIFFHVFLVFVVLILASMSSTDGILEIRPQCPAEVSKVDDVKGSVPLPKWPKTFEHRDVYSDPLCLSEKFDVITRECKAGMWWPREAPTCAQVSPKRSSLYCPPGYTAINRGEKHVCVTVSKTEWSETCRFSPEILEVDKDLVVAVFEHLRERKVPMAWLPVMRMGNFGPLLWAIPGQKWGSPLAIDKDYETIYGNRSQECLLLEVTDKPRLKGEACLASHPYLCIVEGNFFFQGSCPSDHYSSPIPGDNRCFHVEKRDEELSWQSDCVKARVDNLLVGQMLGALGEEHGVEKDEYCWIGGDGRYRSNTMAMTVNGQVVNFYTNMTLHCVYCQSQPLFHQNTEISLKFYQNQRLLLLSVFGESGLWRASDSDPGVRCFTNSNVELVKTVGFTQLWDNRWTVDDIEPDSEFKDRVEIVVDMQKKVYSVDMSDNGPGYYVCQAHTISGELLTTKQVIAYETLQGQPFALRLNVAGMCQSARNCHPTFRNMYETVYRDLRTIESHDVIQNVRPMEIHSVSANGILNVLFHVTAEDDDGNDSGTDEEIGSIESLLAQVTSIFESLCEKYPKVYQFDYLRSGERCPRSTTWNHQTKLEWPSTYVGMTAVPEEMCLNVDGLPVYRVCGGNYMHGGRWMKPTGICASNVPSSTQRLREISTGIQDFVIQYDQQCANEVLEIVQNKEQLTAGDIYYLSQITNYEAKKSSNHSTRVEDISRIAILLDKVMSTDQNILRQSKILNATNMLLDSLETMLDTVSINVTSEVLSGEGGIISIVTPQLIIQISDPTITNITGLALVRNIDNATVSHTFSDYTVVPLSADRTIEDVVGLGDVEVATWLPRNLLQAILHPNFTTLNTTAYNSSVNDNSTTNLNATENLIPKVIVTLFYSDTVFTSEFLVRNDDMVDSRVVSVSVPGYGPHLPIPIPLLFKPLKRTTEDMATCAFWDFKYFDVSTVASYSGWSDDGCQYAGTTRDLTGELNVCLCSHLTHFAQLVLGYFPGPETEGDFSSILHGEALEIITLIGCILSLIGVFGILITAIVFKSWRNKPGTKVLIQLSLALGLEKFLIGVLPLVDANSSPIMCIFTGAMLHYSVLAQFCWMLVTAWLQFKRYVTVLGATRPPRFLLKATAFAWGTPLLIVTVVMAIDPNVYMPEYGSSIQYCQVSGTAQYAGLLAPVILVISLNTILFVRVIHSVLATKKSVPTMDDKGLLIAQIRLAIMLFFLLGITWIFGLVAKMGGGLLFSYLFCITAALQGFVLFFFFIVCDPTTRNLWYSFVGPSKTASKLTLTISATSSVSDTRQRY